MRPIGHQILAASVGVLYSNENDNFGMSLDEIFKILSEKDKEGKFSAHLPGKIFGMALPIIFKKPAFITSNQSLASKLFIYLVRGADRSEQQSF